MKIVYVDEPSYLPAAAIERLEDLGQFSVYRDRPQPDQIVERLHGADVAIVEWSAMPRPVLERCSSLKAIVLVTTGFSRIDVAAAADLGIAVSNTPDYSRQSVAEHTFGLFLALAKGLVPAIQLGRQRGTNYLSHTVGVELYRTTLGVVGVGSIGSWVAKLGLGFGMRVLGVARSRVLVPDVEQVTLDDLAANSNFVALCLPKTSETKALFGRKHFDLLPSNAFIVSTGGESCLDQEAAYEALQSGRLGGLGLDDRPDDDRLAEHDRVLITPGTAWYTHASLDRNINMVIGTVESYLHGNGRYRVN